MSLSHEMTGGHMKTMPLFYETLLLNACCSSCHLNVRLAIKVPASRWCSFVLPVCLVITSNCFGSVLVGMVAWCKSMPFRRWFIGSLWAFNVFHRALFLEDGFIEMVGICMH